MNPGGPAELATVDWTRPWLAPWRALGEPLAEQAGRVGLVDALNAATTPELRLHAGRLRFVAPACSPAGEGYEAFIARTACVPTRTNLHDFFNGLAWLRHPALKRRLNEMQAAAVAAAEPGARRGPLRDALTIFDENAALLRAPAALVEALRRRDWHALFVAERAAWREAQLDLFGHALLEKLVRPRKAITAHVWVLPFTAGDAAEATHRLAAAIDPLLLGTKPVLPLPLPVLGVPGWWPANENPAFYADTATFRPAPNKTATRGSLF